MSFLIKQVQVYIQQFVLLGAVFCVMLPFPVMADEVLDYARLAQSAYSPGSAPAGYTVIAQIKDIPSGFQGQALATSGANPKVVISYAGTLITDYRDLLADVGIGGGEIRQYELEMIQKLSRTFGIDSKAIQSKWGNKTLVPNAKLIAQLKVANSLFDQIVKKYPLNNISVTGHSLGGYLAQAVASRTGVKGLTFNAPGASREQKTPNNNIINYIRVDDVVGITGKHIGSVVKYPNIKFELSKSFSFIINNHSTTPFISDLEAGMKPQ